MKIEEAIEYMSTMYLERILRSYTKDYPKKGENEYRELIKTNVDTLSDYTNIQERLDEYFLDNRDLYEKQILYSFVLKSLLSKSDYYATSEEIIEDVRTLENSVIEVSGKANSFKHIEEDPMKIFSSILEVALEDGVISQEELALIVRLRKKLSLNENDQYLIQAKLNLFPSKGNQIHTREEITQIIDDLQKCGVVFCANQHDEIKETIFVLPEEIVPGIKKAIDIELVKDKYQLLLNKLQNVHLRRILKEANLNVGGVKDELIERVIQAGIKPSSALEQLSVNELSELCGELRGLKKSGLKEEKIDRIINYFADLVVKQVDNNEDPREKYYEYLEELAAQDLNNLLGNQIITKANEIERGFELGTRYLFEKKFNLELVEFGGNEHADGYVRFKNTGNILLWDNKSKLDGKPYKFPDNHFRQFRRYIRNESAEGKRVACFLIITSRIDPVARTNALKLKAESNQDTDIALITAENLKFLAEDWTTYSNDTNLNLHIFSHTGILDRESLKERMKIF